MSLFIRDGKLRKLSEWTGSGYESDILGWGLVFPDIRNILIVKLPSVHQQRMRLLTKRSSSPETRDADMDIVFQAFSELEDANKARMFPGKLAAAVSFWFEQHGKWLHDVMFGVTGTTRPQQFLYLLWLCYVRNGVRSFDLLDDRSEYWVSADAKKVLSRADLMLEFYTAPLRRDGHVNLMRRMHGCPRSARSDVVDDVLKSLSTARHLQNQHAINVFNSFFKAADLGIRPIDNPGYIHRATELGAVACITKVINIDRNCDSECIRKWECAVEWMISVYLLYPQSVVKIDDPHTDLYPSLLFAILCGIRESMRYVGINPIDADFNPLQRAAFEGMLSLPFDPDNECFKEYVLPHIQTGHVDSKLGRGPLRILPSHRAVYNARLEEQKKRQDAARLLEEQRRKQQDASRQREIENTRRFFDGLPFNMDNPVPSAAERIAYASLLEQQTMVLFSLLQQHRFEQDDDDSL